MLEVAGSLVVRRVVNIRWSVAADHILHTAWKVLLQGSWLRWCQQLGILCMTYLRSGIPVLLRMLEAQLPGQEPGILWTDKCWLELGMIGMPVLQDNC